MSGPPFSIRLDIVAGRALAPAQRAEMLALCSRAYGIDYGAIYRLFADPVHVMGWADRTLVSHALWVTRWLQCGDGPLMRTAFVEAVASEPALQGRGFASAVMQSLQPALTGYQLGGLCTGSPGFYARLGWEMWRGPLAIRSDDGLLATPDETVMILRLSDTPPLDLDAPLSAEWRAGELW